MVMPQIESSCLWCRWWRTRANVDGLEIGECHRFAPININNALGSGFAVTLETDFCAQFSPVEGAQKERFFPPVLNERRIAL